MSGLREKIYFWINEGRLRPNQYNSFHVEELVATGALHDEMKSFLGIAISKSFRELDSIKRSFSSRTQEELFKHLEDFVFPVDRNGTPHGASQRMVKSGDFGEIVASCLVQSDPRLELPLSKLLWKFNKDKSLFCTDLFCHDVGLREKRLHYWEVKVRTTLEHKMSEKRGVNHYVAVHAHDALVHDKNGAQDQIADFLVRLYSRDADLLEGAGNSTAAAEKRTLADKYQDILSNHGSYRRSYVVCLILDSPDAFDENMLQQLQGLPVELAELTVKLILVPNLKVLMTAAYVAAYDEIRRHVFG